MQSLVSIGSVQQPRCHAAGPALSEKRSSACGTGTFRSGWRRARSLCGKLSHPYLLFVLIRIREIQ
jgi:hypothetical protein